MAQSCLHIVIHFLRPPGPNRCMPYWSSYHQPVPNSATFCKNVEIPLKWKMGKCHSSAQNSSFRGKLGCLKLTTSYTEHTVHRYRKSIGFDWAEFNAPPDTVQVVSEAVFTAIQKNDVPFPFYLVDEIKPKSANYE